MGLEMHVPEKYHRVHSGFGIGGTRLSPEPQVSGYEDEKNHGDDTIHGKECGIELAQVAGRNQGVLIEQQQRDYGYAQLSGHPKLKERGEPGQEHDDRQVQKARDPEGGVEAKRLGNAEESGLAIMLHIL